MTDALPPSPSPTRSALPPDDLQRALLHNEVHARPTARIRLPALVVYVAVLNEGISREQELAHLRLLPGQQDLPPEVLHDHFVRLRLGNCTLKWERHSEYTRYSIVQSLPEGAGLEAESPPLDALAIDPDWLAAIPGRTITAIKLAMVIGDIANAPEAARRGQRWLGGRSVVASIMGTYGHSIAVTSFRLREDGFEHMLVIAPERTTETRAGRISQRLLELETYRMMALRGLPAAKALSPMLAEAESRLAEITARLENKAATDQELLDTLVALAARVERATAENQYRFAATQAYDAIVSQRIQELREKPISGTQTISEFMQRRLSPAIQTVAATAQRLSGLSQRIERTSALLRTRVDIATESQNQQLLAQLTRGQDLQLRMQMTVEGLSIAAISYYVMSLIYYGAKAVKVAGVPISPELVAGALIPAVLWGVWRTNRRIHEKLHAEQGH